MKTPATISRISVIEQEIQSGRALIVRVEALGNKGERFVGVGETPSFSKGTSQSVLATAHELCSSLRNADLPIDQSQEALSMIDALLENSRDRSAPELRDPNVFNYSRFAVETALLDLVATALGISVAQLLGAVRMQPEVAPRSRSLARDDPGMQSGSQSWRLSLSGNPKEDLDALATRRAQNERTDRWWLEGKEKYDLKQAKSLIKGLFAQNQYTWPRAFILEQPVPQDRVGDLGKLQRYADRLIRRTDRNDLEFTVMSAGGHPSAEDSLDTWRRGGWRGINIKPAQIGGLLRTRELIERAVGSDPRRTVILSGLTSATETGIQALHHLAGAIPAVAYVTRRSPVREPLHSQIGFGVNTRLDSIFERVTDYAQFPDAGGTRGPIPARQYPEEVPTNILSKPAMRSHLVEREALMHGLATVRYNATAFAAEAPSGETLFFGASARAFASSAPSFTISDKHKGAAQALLERSGVAVPRGRIFPPNDSDGAEQYASEIGYPVVCKPVSGTGGAGVSVNIWDSESLRSGFAQIEASARYGKEDVLVQEHIDGDVYRIMVSDEKVIAVIKRIPPVVVGDGQRTIAELVLEKNVLRLRNPRLRKGLIERERTKLHLESIEMTLDSVPAQDQRVALASNAYLNRGGESIDVLDETHISILREAVRTVKAIPGLNYCGVDILLADHKVDIAKQRAGVCELNSCPELITPQYPLYGRPRYVARELLYLSARRHNVALPSAVTDELSLFVTIKTTGGEGYINWMHSRARGFGLRGWVAPGSEGTVHMLVSGPAIPVSVLVSGAWRPSQGLLPTQVRTEHARSTPTGPFTIVDRLSSGKQVPSNG